MPSDNIATIGAGIPVEFPNNGSTNNTSITRLTASTFNLANTGIYEITFQISITEPGQLVVVLDTVEIPYTVVGRATGTDQIIGISLITTIKDNSILSINNPSGNSTALKITPYAGGTHAVSANLIIKQFV